MLVVDKLSKSYPTRGEPLEVLREVSLTLSAGQSAAVVGPSGSGKSTLLHILGTLDPPTSGTVNLLNTNPFTLAEPALAAFRNRHIGFVFQEHYLLPQLTVLENTLIPAIANGNPHGEVVQWGKELLQRVGLSERLSHRPAELSGGERQRVAVARALVNKPALVLADEPTGSLDRRNALSVAKLLLDLQSSLRAILIVVTHSSEIAALFSQRFEIDDGKLNSPE